MAHKHSVYDTDAHFKIDPVTRAIKNASSGKTVLIQYDHNSERFTFEIPRLVDGHDMSLCNLVEIHYINIDYADKAKAKPGVYEVTDLQISPDDEEVVIGSWLVSQNATEYAGSLNFLLKFKCIDENGEVTYRWHTGIFSGISVSNGMDNGTVIVEEYADVLAQWKLVIDKVEADMESIKQPLDDLVENGVKVTEQTFTYDQQAQARKNIGAMEHGVATLVSPDGDMVEISGENSIKDDTGYTIAGRVGFYAIDNDQRVILSRIHDGIDDDDAATVGQVKAVEDTAVKKNTEATVSSIKMLHNPDTKDAINVIGSVIKDKDDFAVNALSLVGDFNGEQIDADSVILRGIHKGEDPSDAVNKAQMEEAILTAIANLPVYNGEVEEV